MKMMQLVFGFLPGLTLLLPTTAWAAAPSFEQAIRPFLKAHCVRCHGATDPKGDLRLDTLKVDFQDAESAATWSIVREQLRAGTMPPKDQPVVPAETKKVVLEQLSQKLRGVPQPPVVRRLNRVEYENTLRDLLDLPGLEVKEMLPADGQREGFDTVATALDVSYVQMAQYMQAADTALVKAAGLSLLNERPALQKLRYYPQHCSAWWHRSKEGATVPLTKDGPDPSWQMDTGVVEKSIDEHKIPPVKAMGTFFHSDPAGLLRLMHDRQKVPIAGLYRLHVSAYTFQWKRGVLVPSQSTHSFSLATQTRILGYFDAPPDEPTVSTVTTWLEPDTEIHFNAVTLMHGHGMSQGAATVDYSGVAVEWMDVEGPLIETWPPVARQAMFKDLPIAEWKSDADGPRPRRLHQSWLQIYTPSSLAPEDDAQAILRTFMSRACRRPMTNDEVRPYFSLFKAKFAESASFEEAIRTAERAILTSADFLFLSRESDKSDLYALASRLSYFLWSSLPDEELTRAAADGSLAKPKVLRAQTERLLSDPKSNRFVENFTGQWLKLRDINSTQPDRQLYPEGTWESDVAAYPVDSMLSETRMFFADMVREDLSVTNVIDSRFSFINEPLARLYGIEGVRGAIMRKTPIPVREGRGGLLTQASILKVSANGTTTSPVVRGVYVATRLLGQTIPPPPPNITGIEPDLRGVTTIREQLAKHSTNTSCAACHAKMDPPGFALENFDVVGVHRDRYRILQNQQLQIAGPAIDASGEMRDGRPFKDVEELKKLLLDAPDQLARNLAVQLATYATGRKLSGADRLEVDEIVDRLKAKNYGTRALIHEIVQSGMMRGP